MIRKANNKCLGGTQLKRGDLPSLHKALCSSPNMQLEKINTFTFIYNIENKY